MFLKILIEQDLRNLIGYNNRTSHICLLSGVLFSSQSTNCTMNKSMKIQSRSCVNFLSHMSKNKTAKYKSTTLLKTKTITVFFECEGTIWTNFKHNQKRGFFIYWNEHTHARTFSCYNVVPVNLSKYWRAKRIRSTLLYVVYSLYNIICFLIIFRCQIELKSNNKNKIRLNNIQLI